MVSCDRVTSRIGLAPLRVHRQVTQVTGLDISRYFYCLLDLVLAAILFWCIRIRAACCSFVEIGVAWRSSYARGCCYYSQRIRLQASSDSRWRMWRITCRTLLHARATVICFSKYQTSIQHIGVSSSLLSSGRSRSSLAASFSSGSLVSL